MSDNGFLKLDNAIIDYWMSRLNHSEFKTLLAIYRKTIGWSKQYDRISQTQISELSGITTRSVRTAITSLEELGLILTTGNSKSSKVFTLNTKKLFDVCLKSEDALEIENKLESISNEQENNSHIQEENSCDDANNFLHKRHSKDTNKKQAKEITSTVINIPFDVFWDLYDYKKNKSDCVTKWHSMTDEERTLTIESLDLYKQSTPDKTYRKYPLNYLENECWNDEHVVVIDKEAAHNKNNTYNNTYSNDVFSASHKEFEPVITAKDTVSTNHTKDELECNLEALGISSGTTIHNDTTVNRPADIVALSSKVHWSELKAKGLLKVNKNPTAIAPNTSKSKEIDDFLSRFSSKGKCSSKNIIIGNSVIDNDCIS